MENSTLTHKIEKRSGSGINQPKVITLFNDDDRFKFIHTEQESINDAKEFFYDFSEENLFSGNIYDFISRCFNIAQENGGCLMFKGKQIIVKDKTIRFSGAGIDEIENIVVIYGDSEFNLIELIDYEF